MTNLASSFGLSRAGAAHKYGGRIAIGDGGNLPIHFGADGYSVVPGGTLRSLPEWPAGRPVALRFDGVSTIANSAKLATPGGLDYVTVAGDEALLVPLGALGWQAVIVPNWLPLRYDAAQSLSATQKRQALINLSAHFLGQCQLVLSAGVLKLNRFNGRYVVINGNVEEVPAVAPQLAAAGLTVGTLYYIYAYMNAGVMTLEASATGHSADATTGVEIKTGDATRTLVGMARPVTGPAWADSLTQRFVRSWFSRQTLYLKNSFTASRSTTSTTLVEINSEIRCEYLAWLGETISASLQARHSVSSASGTRIGTGIGFDGAFSSGANLEMVPDGTGAYPVSLRASTTQAEGYHYATLMGIVSASTGNWSPGSTLVDYPTISVEIG